MGMGMAWAWARARARAQYSLYAQQPQLSQIAYIIGAYSAFALLLYFSTDKNS
jgi:hypothetical protein